MVSPGNVVGLHIVPDALADVPLPSLECNQSMADTLLGTHWQLWRHYKSLVVHGLAAVVAYVHQEVSEPDVPEPDVSEPDGRKPGSWTEGLVESLFPGLCSVCFVGQAQTQASLIHP